MKENYKISKKKTKLLIILGIVTLFIVVLIFTFNGIIAGILERKTDNYLREHPIKHYKIQYDKIGFNLLNRSINIKGISYTPDSIFIDSLSKSGYELYIPEMEIGKIAISGIGFKKILQNKFVQTNKIKISNATFIINKISGNKLPNKSGKGFIEKDNKSVMPDSILVNGLNGLQINKLIFTKAKIILFDVKNKQSVLSVEKLHIQLNTIKLVKSRFNNNYLYTELGQSLLSIKDFAYKTSGKLYNVTFDNLQISHNIDTVTIYNLHYKPIFSKSSFSKHIKFQKERYDIKVEKFTIIKPDLTGLYIDNRLTVKKISITNPYISIYRDKRVPFKHGVKPKLPYQALKQMTLGLNIDTVNIEKGTFIYEEKTDLNSKTLYLSINNISANITNINNIKTSLNKVSSMKVKLEGKLMREAPMTLQMIFPMKTRNDTFVFSGAVYGRVPFTIFNKAIYPATGIKFKNGTLNKLTFRGGANSTYSQGTMLMLYNNISLNVIKKDEKNRIKFLSWGATAVIRKNNPIGKKPPKKVYMYFERDKERGMGNFLWKTIFSGMKATLVGGKNSKVKNRPQKNTKQTKKRNRRKKN